MASNPTFGDRMFMEAEGIYAAIERGEVQDATAALLDAQYRASSADDES
ncbi:hypothetical protein [Streptomyces sp. CB03238]|nr:hypothetical protein [Streptomyces sp. CB03238]